MRFIVLNCQVVEWVDIFANPVLKNPGINKNKARNKTLSNGKYWLFSRVLFDSVISVKQVPQERIYKNYIILNLNLRLTMKKHEKSFDGYSLFSLKIWCKYGSGKW